MKISKELKLDNIRNMRGMIDDFRSQYDRFPTNLEFEKRLGLSNSTVRRYRDSIHKVNVSITQEKFKYDIIYVVNDLIDDLNKHIKIYKEMRDDEDISPMDKIKICESIEESRINLIRVMRDTPEYFHFDPSVMEFTKDDDNTHDDNDIFENFRSYYDNIELLPALKQTEPTHTTNQS